MSGGWAVTLLALAAAAVWMVALGLRVLPVAARMFQIEEYEAPRVVRWALSPAWIAHRSVLLIGAAVIAGDALLIATGDTPSARQLFAALWLAGGAAAATAWRWLPPKKKLVLTPRMRRLLGATAVVLTALAAGLALALLLATPWWAVLTVTAACLGLTALPVLLLVAVNGLLIPVESSIRRGFLRRARAKLQEIDPLVIAVAGSYGKTSTKHILAHLLERYGSTLATPKSFNTLMGVSRTINDDLLAGHRTFIVEMDAYAPGEIAAICRLARPRHALLTSVGPQHLERFGSLERIADALYEVIEALPADGFVMVHTGDPRTAALAARARSQSREVIGYAIASSDVVPGGATDVVASDVSIDGSGTHFTWSWPARGLSERVAVPLLGRHQALNVSAALATVYRLGLPLEPALAALETLRPVDHRLQPVPTGNAITVIDDSYNANPVGVHNALEVLEQLDATGRILVTPGLVELGSVEDAENMRYGEHAARVCDHVIVMEARPARALREGLRAGGMDDEHVHVVRSLADATALLGRIARPGDAVLFANDLPDTYLGAA